MRDPAEGEHLAPDTIRRRATSGVLLVGIRGLAVRGIAFVAFLVLARLLTPAELGIAALGIAVSTFGAFLADTGLGSALIGRREPPRHAELTALAGLQLVVTLLLAIGAGGVALVLRDQTADVIALFVASLPILVLRAPAAIVLERQLRYATLVTVEVVEVVVFSAAAIGLALVDQGAYSLAYAAVAKSIAGTVLLAAVEPSAFVRPSLAIAPVRRLLAFGARFQAASLTVVAREQATSYATALIAGVGTLGQWSLASRLLSVPLLVFDALWRVAYPAIARLLESGAAARPLLERAALRAALVTGLAASTLGAAGPLLVPAIFGSEWTEAADVIPLGCAAIAIGSPLSVVAIGYLYATDDSSTVLRVMLVETAAQLAVAVALLSYLDALALGVAWIVAAVIGAVMLGRSVQATTGTSLAAQVGPSAVAASAISAAGAGAAATLDSGLLAGSLAGAAGAVGFVGVTAITRRDAIAEVRALRTAISRRASAPEPR